MFVLEEWTLVGLMIVSLFDIFCSDDYGLVARL